MLWGWKRFALAALAGAVSTLALPPIGLFPILFVTFPIFFLLIDGSAIAARRGGVRALVPAFFVGWWFGFGYFLCSLYWIGAAFLVEQDKFIVLMPLAVLSLPAGLAVFTGVGAALARLLWSSSPWRIVSFAFGLAFCEMLRGVLFTGFPWNNFALGFTANTLQMQIVSLTGIYPLCLLVVFCAASPALLFDPAERGGQRKAPLVLALLMLALQFGFGTTRLSRAVSGTVPNVRLRVVQPNITQPERSKLQNREEIVERLLSLSAGDEMQRAQSDEVVNGAAAPPVLPTHIIWPESSLPFLVTSVPQVLTRIETMLQPGQSLIAGLSRAEDGGAGAKQKNIFNSIYIFADDGRVLDRYDKLHLVPFGEYLPFNDFAQSLGMQPVASLKGYSAGLQRNLMTAPGAPPFLPLICYEVIFSNDLFQSGDRPGWIVNVSDDSWFGHTLGPYQHLHQARLRAVEEGLPVVRSTTTGVSAVIDAYGRIQHSLALGEAAVIDSGLPKALPRTRFSLSGGNITLYFFAIFGVLAVLIRRSAKQAL